MEAIYSSETSIEFQRTTLRYIPEASTLHNHRCDNLKSYTEVVKLGGYGFMHVKAATLLLFSKNFWELHP
jgi:hypothetical protein